MRCLVVILLMGIVFACSRHEETGFHGMRYDSVDPVTDSLTFALEKALYCASPIDSVQRLVENLGAGGESSKGFSDKEKKARYYYWKSRLMRRSDQFDSAKIYIDRSLAEVDSQKYYYTYRRIQTMKTSMGTGEAKEYMVRLMNDLDYYKSIGDKAMEASVCILIANVLVISHQPDFALDYLARADSLHTDLGLSKYVSRNKINVASAYSALNRQDKAADILLSIKNDSSVREDAKAYNTVCRNLYIYTGNVDYLNEAYSQSLSDDSLSPVNAVFEVLLSRYFKSDSVSDDEGKGDYYARKALSRLPHVKQLSHRSAIFQSVSKMYSDKGQMDSAYHYLELSVREKEKDEEMRQPDEIARIRNIQVLAEHEYQQNKTRHVYTIRLLILSIIVIMAIAIALYVINKIRQKHRLEAQRMQMDKMSTELEMERRQRQYLALSLAMEDTDRNLSQLKEKIDTLCREGKLSGNEKKEVDGVIKMQMTHRDDWYRFNELFEKAHPQFETNLRNRYPGLSESQVKLATYVYTGMDNKQIASFLNIRPESVKQARWRLRSKMGLQAEESLEDKLRELVSNQ